MQFSGLATVGADGTVQIQLGPNRGGERWTCLRYTVTNDSAVQASTAAVYRNFVAPTAVIDVTGTGAFDSSSLSPPVSLAQGESLIAKWEDADPGSTSVFTIDVDVAR